LVALAQAALAAVQQGEAPQMRMGTIAFGSTGKVTWHDNAPERPRVRYVVITEQGDLRQRGLL
jgi:hypothetical protein